ncbi:PTR2-domain-containing protein [Karstenula rhodostoma CBS 690.94]|uniref:PTR2-domain-containing protein n=1 Tax=Karstenula rhodostoma CBS 690.94 TaxID=1392251 RepID=A0A9P4U8N5_9PLEO|nr:PTR2-domain-containing protein [Karstenula rhodostoma CBS 690.94]
MAIDIEIQDVNINRQPILDEKAPPNDSEYATLRRVADNLPKIALLILAVEATSTALGNFFKFWAYGSTIIGAIVADQYLGKFKAILVASGIYTIGLIILVPTATPSAIQDGAGFGGLIAAMITIGLGTGGIKANVTPMCAEQYQNARPIIKILKTDEKVVIDPELTVQKLFSWFYWVVNVGALSQLITVNVEAKHFFWLAYLIPLIVTVISFCVFLLGHKRYVKVPPQSSAIVDAVKTVTIACREKGFQNAKPSTLSGNHNDGKYKIAQEARYTDACFEGILKGVKSCKMFLFFLFYFIFWTQIWNNLISQAGQMALYGTPNDLLQNLDSIALIIFIPSLDMVVYPSLQKMKIDFDSVSRIFVGFLLVSISMMYASVLQHFIYKSAPNSIHVWIQAPSLRSFISALFWITIGIAAAICIALAPVSQDPYMVWTYASLGIVGFAAGCVFFLCFRKDRKWSADAVVLEAVHVDTNSASLVGKNEEFRLGEN